MSQIFDITYFSVTTKKQHFIASPAMNPDFKNIYLMLEQKNRDVISKFRKHIVLSENI